MERPRPECTPRARALRARAPRAPWARCLAGPLVALLWAACPGPTGGGDGGPPDGGGPDAAAAPTGAPCPEGDPARCAGHVCITGEGGQTYCSEYCEAGSCPDGFPCQRYPFDGADLREICAPRCDRDEQCLSMACDEATGRCLFPGDGTQGPGEPCGGDAGLCRYGNLCVTQEAGRRCMATCNPDADPFCADGAFCFPALAPGGGLCWLGGTAGPGAPCLSHRDCPLGYLCLEARVGEPSCRKGCDPRDGEPGCPAGTECLTVPEKVYGFCR